MSRKQQAPDQYESQLLGGGGNNNNNRQQANPGEKLVNMGKLMIKPDEVALNRNFLKYSVGSDFAASVFLLPYVTDWWEFKNEEWETWIIAAIFLNFLIKSVVMMILGKVKFKEE